MRFLSLLLLFVSFIHVLSSQTVDAGGYVKYLLSHSSISAIGTLDSHLLHSRFNTKLYPAKNLTAALEVRARIYYGDIVRKVPDFVQQIRGSHEQPKLDLVLWEKSSSIGYAEIDRLWVDWTLGEVQLTLGRQRIALGTNLVWNPIDLFNPYSILDFDYEERPGSDAVRMQYYFGPLSKIEAAFKTGKTLSTAIIMISSNIFDYDVHFIGGQRRHKWVAGTAWAGDIAGGGFRGEILLSQKPDKNSLFANDRPSSSATIISCALSGDYTFPNSLYVHSEMLYNSEGVTSQTALNYGKTSELGLLSPARWSMFGEISYMISPLVRTSFFTIYNPSDLSRVYVPSVTWSVSSNVDVTLIALLFGGDELTEFGESGTSVYARATWSF